MRSVLLTIPFFFFLLCSCAEEETIEGEYGYTNCECNEDTFPFHDCSIQNQCFFKLVLEEDKLIYMINSGINIWTKQQEYELIGGEWTRISYFKRDYHHPYCLVTMGIEIIKENSLNGVDVEYSMYDVIAELDGDDISMCSRNYIRFLFNYAKLTSSGSKQATRL